MPEYLVIFDCDGVLVDSEPIANRVFHEALTSLGVKLSPEETMDRFTGRSLKDCIEEIEILTNNRTDEEFWKNLQGKTFDAFEQELEPVAGITEVVKKLSWPFCVASSGSISKMKKTLGLTGLLPYFDGKLFSAQDIGNGKPAPDIFLHAADSMSFPPHRCFVVEDSLPGVQAGQRAGMQVFGYTRHTPSEKLSDFCCETFSHMDKLVSILDRYS